VIIAHISDPHIRRKGHLLHHMIDTAKALRRCVAQLNALDPRPDVVLATGDLSESGKPKEYRRLRRILASLEIPLYPIVGNHDRRKRFLEAFADAPYAMQHRGFVQYCIDTYPVRLIGLDSLAAKGAGGELDEARLAWLEQCLAERPHTPTLLFMHHPPYRTGIRAMDARGFRGAEALGAVVARHSQIERIVCGHIHRPTQVRWNGTIVCTAPSTSHQFVLALRAHQPLGFVLEPPGYLLHVKDDGVMVTRTCTIGKLRGPFKKRRA